VGGVCFYMEIYAATAFTEFAFSFGNGQKNNGK